MDAFFQFFELLFDPVGFPRRWYCGAWSESLGWIHIVSDVLTGVAYFSIPIAIIYFIRRKKNIPFNFLFWMFALFIFSCGIEHFIEASIFWHPWYRLAGLVKVCTAVFSLATLIVLVKTLPSLIEIPETLQAGKKLSSIVEALPFAVFVLDKDGLISSVNKKAIELFYYQDVHDVLGKSVIDLIPIQFHNEFIIALKVCQESKDGNSARIEKMISTNNKNVELTLDVFLQKLNIDDDSCAFLMAIADLTEIEKANLEMEERTSKHLHAVLDTMIDGVITIDPKGIVETMNPAAEKIFGKSVQDVLGKNVSILMPEPYASAHDQYLENYMTTGKAKIIGIGQEVLGKGADGSVFPLSLAVSEMMVNGNKKFCGIVRDISQQKAYEQQLETQNQSLKHLNEDLEQFVYITSHDLQEPLRAIYSYIQILEKAYLQDINEDGRYYLNNIYKGAERMRGLIKGVLNYSKLQQVEEGFSNINMENLIQGISSLIGLLTEKSNVKIEFQKLLPVYGYEPFILTLFQNIISNGIKYNKRKRPCITINSKIYEESPGKVLYSISDNGIGISKRYFKILFKMFQRLNIGAEYKGLGIGLACCKRIVELHHGKIWLDSKVGVGTTFFFTLPKGTIN